MIILSSLVKTILTIGASIASGSESPPTNRGRSIPLELLTFVTFSGSEPFDGLTCKAAIQVAVDGANAHPTILSRYKIVANFQDEGFMASKAARGIIEFHRNFSSGNDSAYVAPVLVGPITYCNYMTSVARQYDMVQFSTGCVGPVFTANRKKFPNLYRVGLNADLLLPPLLWIVKNIGNWKQVGIVVYAEGINNEVAGSKMAYQALENAGVKVLSYVSVVSINPDIFSALKTSKSRIIITFFLQPNMQMTFLCEAYRHGLTGPDYIFIAAPPIFVVRIDQKAKLPAACSRDILIEQMKRFFWYGEISEFSENPKVSSLGYSVPEFERRLSLLMNGTQTQEFSRRHACHDAMLNALLSLDAGEKLLNSKYNLSLADYATNSDIVMEAVNQSAPSVKAEYIFERMNWSDRLERDYKVVYIAQWHNHGIRYLTKIWFTGNSSSMISNLSMYDYAAMSTPIWWTHNGRPPKDLSSVIHIRDDITPQALLYTIIGLATLFTIGNLVFSMFILSSGKTASKAVDSSLRVLFAVACAVDNVTAIAFQLDSVNEAVCNLRIISAVVGATLTSLTLFIFVLCLVEQIENTNFLFDHVKNRIHLGNAPRSFMPQSVSWFFPTWLFGIIAILVAWLTYDSAKSVTTVSEDFFEESEDSYMDIVVVRCTSKNQLYWGATTASLNGALLLTSLLKILTVPSRQTHRRLKVPVLVTKIACINANSMYALCVLLGSTLEKQVWQNAIWSFFVLLFGNLTFALVSVPSLLKHRNRRSSRVNTKPEHNLSSPHEGSSIP